MLPRMVYSDNIQSTTQVQFGGYNHTKNASEGEIYDMANMTSDNYPLLSSRPKRKTFIQGLSDCSCFYMDNDYILIHDSNGVQIKKTNSNTFTTIGPALAEYGAKFSVARNGNKICIAAMVNFMLLM